MSDNANTNATGAATDQAAATGGGAAGGNGNVPVAVLGSLATDWANVVIGYSANNFIWPTPNPAPVNSYWYVVIDLTNLNVVANVTSTSNSDVPSQVSAYAGNPQYLLILTTIGLRFDNLPVGALYSFLQSTGSGEHLEEAQQMAAQLGTGYYGDVGYILAATMNSADAPGFELLQIYNQPLLLFQLMPVNVDGSTIYAPIRTGL